MIRSEEKNKTPFYIAPGDTVSPDIVDQLKKINENCSKSKNFKKYMQDIQTFFNLNPAIQTTESKLFLGGFIEGEGSLNVSAKKHKTAKFGITVDPEFSITQHINGVHHLYLALHIFQAGRIRYKSGSNGTLVFTIDNRITLEEKVIPFFESYVLPYASPIKSKRLQTFKKIIGVFKKDGHCDLDPFVNELLPLWDSLRMQRGQSNESFALLEDAQNHAENFYRSKTK